MWVKDIKIRGFRNLIGLDGEELEISFSPGINILRGLNAQGKTNLIEAVHFCAALNSHRGSQNAELIRLGAEEAHIGAVVARGEYSDRINILLKHINKTRAAKSAAVNGMVIDRLGEMLGVLYCVVFSPEDLALIKSGPTERRRFMDMELCQINRVYYYELKKYYKILKQRNTLLKLLQKDFNHGKHENHETLEIWDKQISASGQLLSKIRRSFVEELSILMGKIHFELSGEEITAAYKPSAASADYADKILKARRKDIAVGQTTLGIHKDDIVFTLNGLNSRVYGSQGQQRTAALSLKLAECELIRREKGENPVLLLDDVFSELDNKRRERLLETVSGLQTIITCAAGEDILPHLRLNPTEFVVNNGMVARV